MSISKLNTFSECKSVAHFNINFIQYLNEDGQLCAEAPAFCHDKILMLSLYRAIKLLHLFDLKVLNLHRAGQMGTYTGTLGQEAVGIGAASCLTDNDVFVPYYRSAPDLYWRGVKLHEILMYWGGDERGSDFADPRLINDFPIPIVIASQLLHAAGVASAIKLRQQKNRAVLTLVGDGGTSEGDFYEALNVAGAWQLPLVIIINNNRWALSEPNTRQTACQTLAQKAIAGGIEGVQVDGNDVIAMRAVTEAALAKARAGGGATLIEALTYRLCAHTTIDDATRYVASEELDQAWQREPLKRLKTWLITNEMLDAAQDANLEIECRAEVEREVEIFLNMPIQAPTAIFDFLYAELPERLLSQRDDVIKHRGS
ncbi:MAG: thiamine pyrophosphate-dependent dehydrogenase E1 component subunit alpha [Gammaproteobacteria bacterium]|nr:thiamine pyrophosphate-dependent dehydrogenase E1 component subunit alpha [Gammaproteobacteria bacterium]